MTRNFKIKIQKIYISFHILDVIHQGKEAKLAGKKAVHQRKTFSKKLMHESLQLKLIL